MTLNTAVVAPMPNVNEIAAVKLKAGALMSWRVQ